MLHNAAVAIKTLSWRRLDCRHCAGVFKVQRRKSNMCNAETNLSSRTQQLRSTLEPAGVLLRRSTAYLPSPIFIAAVSAVSGWVIAERNALQLRVSQWPIFSEYIDWDRVRRDSGDGA